MPETLAIELHLITRSIRACLLRAIVHSVSQNPSWLYPRNYRLKETWETGLSTCRCRNGQPSERVRPFVTTEIDLTASIYVSVNTMKNESAGPMGYRQNCQEIWRKKNNNQFSCRTQIVTCTSISFPAAFTDVWYACCQGRYRDCERNKRQVSQNKVRRVEGGKKKINGIHGNGFGTISPETNSPTCSYEHKWAKKKKKKEDAAYQSPREEEENKTKQNKTMDEENELFMFPCSAQDFCIVKLIGPRDQFRRAHFVERGFSHVLCALRSSTY